MTSSIQLSCMRFPFLPRRRCNEPETTPFLRQGSDMRRWLVRCYAIAEGVMAQPATKKPQHCRGFLIPAVSTSNGSSRELEPFGLWLEARAKDRRVERISKAVPHERRVFIFDVHVELADIVHEEIHDGAVVSELPPREHHLIRALLVQFP